jgi:hypothetical protein
MTQRKAAEQRKHLRREDSESTRQVTPKAEPAAGGAIMIGNCGPREPKAQISSESPPISNLLYWFCAASQSRNR